MANTKRLTKADPLPPGTRWCDRMGGFVCVRCGRYADCCMRVSGQGVPCHG